MVTGWRRAFCSSIPKEKERETKSSRPVSTTDDEQKLQQNCQSPRFGSSFGFFSNPSTPRLQSQPVSNLSLRCKTSSTSSVPNSPKLQCKTSTTTTTTGTARPKKTTNSSIPRRLSSLFSHPSSPNSPSTFSFLKTSLRLSKNRCAICLQSVKTGQGTAIFTAECSHSFHFPCMANHIKKHHQLLLTCPVCNSHWNQVPVLSFQNNFTTTTTATKDNKETKSLKVYNDDEPLGSPISLSHFNPIPESDEDEEFQGFLLTAPAAKSNLEISLLPESALVATGRSYETYAMVLKVRAPPFAAAVRGIRRAPVDLITVVDVSLSIGGGPKLQMMKRAMRLVISSLSSFDRLSIVAFSNASKRLMPLRRMTTNGRRLARRIVDALGITGQGMSANDALKKAVKVLEDRREKNPFASIMILSESNAANHCRSSPVVSSTRFSDSDIVVHSVAFNVYGACNNHGSQLDEAFVKCVSDLLSVVAQDLKLQVGFVSGSAPADIEAVYSLTGRPVAHGSGSIRLGDLHAEEEKELLIELKVPAPSIGSRHVLSVRSSYKDPSSQELIRSREQSMLAPRPQAVRSSHPSIVRLRNLHISTRAIAESGRLMELNDLSGAYHLLSSARALLLQRRTDSADEYLPGLEGELAELQNRRRRQQVQSQRQRVSSGQQAEEKPEPLTPTSAWRAAERLAKVAIMRKHMNRVSDLHGFENARF